MKNEIISNFESLSEENMEKFVGKWIAVLDNKIILSEDSFKKLYSKLQEKYPNKKPLIGKVPDKNPIVFSS